MNRHELRRHRESEALACFVEGASLMLAPSVSVEARAAAMVQAAIAIVHLRATDEDGRVEARAREFVAEIKRQRAADAAD